MTHSHGSHRHDPHPPDGIGGTGAPHAGGVHAHAPRPDAHAHAPGPDPHAPGSHPSSAELAALLDIDARVLGGYLTEVTAWLADLDPSARTIVDLGAGTGTGAFALAEAFPEATVVAVDNDPIMLRSIRRGAASRGLGARVQSRAGDLDAPGLVLPAGADIAWLAGSLHHAVDPEATLAVVHQSLRPGGLLVVLEQNGFPRVLPEDVEPAGLSDRLRAAAGWREDHAWAAALQRAGFEPVEVRTVTDTADQAAGAGAYARQWLTRLHRHAAGQLTIADRRALEALLVEDGPLTDPALAVETSRTVWIVRRPQAPAAQVDDSAREVDVAVIGGGPAGLAAAVVLGRSRRSVVVLDSGRPRNAPAEGAHNVLGHEGASPFTLLAAGRAEAADYGVAIWTDPVAAVSREDDRFQIETAGGRVVRARRLVLATGLRDELPPVPGLAEHWGQAVLHCPYCHGWEVRDQRVAVLMTSPMQVHQVLLMRQLTERLTVLRQDVELSPEDRSRFAALGIQVLDGTVTAVESDPDGTFAGVSIEGRRHAFDALVVAPRFVANAALYEALGGEVTEHPMGSFVAVDAEGRTALPGVRAVGNVADLGAVVAAASASGVTAGARLNAELCEEDAARAGRPAS